MRDRTTTTAELTRAAAIVEGALNLCGKRGGWTRRYFARDRHSHEVVYSSPRAIRFCVAGAICRAGLDTFGMEVNPLDALEGAPVPRDVRLAFEACGRAFVDPLIALGIDVEVIGEGVVVHESDDTPWCRLAWPELVDFANEHPKTRHAMVVQALTSAPDDLRKAARKRSERGAK